MNRSTSPYATEDGKPIWFVNDPDKRDRYILEFSLTDDEDTGATFDGHFEIKKGGDPIVDECEITCEGVTQRHWELDWKRAYNRYIGETFRSYLNDIVCDLTDRDDEVFSPWYPMTAYEQERNDESYYDDDLPYDDVDDFEEIYQYSLGR